MSQYKLACPHCRQKIRIRSSEGQHLLMRNLYLQCVNEACGFTAAARLEMTSELSPSAMPNPEVKLPIADAAIRRLAMISRIDDDQGDLFDQLENTDTLEA